MDEFAMLLAELDRCRTEFQHLQNELNLATGAGPTDIAALQHAARRMSGIAHVFIERLWRSLKHEDIYLKGYADGREAKAGIASWIAFYNDRRLHQAHGYRTPMAVWRERMLAAKAVDMVDNADALTTCPQQLQQTESLAA